MQPTHQSTKTQGFTLIEMLVVAPLIILVIATIVGFMISLVGNVAIANARTQVLYDTQDALSQIEQDVFLSTGFLASFTPSAPQGENDATGAFTSASNDIIFSQPATTKSPADSTRQLIYYANTPEPCAGQVQINTLFYTKTIYFVKNSTLYRRIIVPPNNQTGTPAAEYTCSAPWQRNSCASINQGGYALCVSKDTKLLDNVSAFSATYYDKANPGAALTPVAADSIAVSITTTKKIAGESISSTLEIAASRTNN